jgi:hypothetical protein
MATIVANQAERENPCDDEPSRLENDNATAKEALSQLADPTQCGFFAALTGLGGLMNPLTGTTACFGFLGFLASLFPRNWPFAMVILLDPSEVIRLSCGRTDSTD